MGDAPAERVTSFEVTLGPITMTPSSGSAVNSPHETHGDHVAVFEAAKEAARKCSLLCYESISAPKEFVPNYFVDITPYLPDKLSAVSSHRTQRGKFYMNEELVKGRAAHRGLQAGVPYAEAFWIYRWVR